MRVAVSITKVFEIEKDMNLQELERQFQEQFDGSIHSPAPMDWYDIEECQEIWSFAIVA